MALKLGLLGGSFDPVHNGHLIVARSIAERRNLDSIVFLPSATPPHKKRTAQADAHHRAAMVNLAIADEPRFELSRFDLDREGPTYTIETVEYFKKRSANSNQPSGVDLFWIIGADWISEIASWHRAGELIDACNIVTASRAGCAAPDWESLRNQLNESRVEKIRAGVVETPVIEISSTMIRDRVANRQSIRYLVPESVRQYIGEQGLYASGL